jgi:hypothetical protein
MMVTLLVDSPDVFHERLVSRKIAKARIMCLVIYIDRQCPRLNASYSNLKLRQVMIPANI